MTYIEKHNDDVDNYYIDLDISFRDQERLYALIDYITVVFLKKKETFLEGFINLKTNLKNTKPVPKYILTINQLLYFIDLTLFLITGKTMFEKSEEKYVFYACDNGTAVLPLLSDEFVSNTYKYFEENASLILQQENSSMIGEMITVLKKLFSPIEFEIIEKTLKYYIGASSCDYLVQVTRNDYAFSYFTRSKTLIDSSEISMFETLTDFERENYACLEYGHGEVFWRYKKSQTIKNYITSLELNIDDLFVYSEVPYL